MKKLSIILCLCALLTLCAFATEAVYGTYDVDRNGIVEVRDALMQLHTLLNENDKGISLLNVLHTLKTATTSEAVDATVSAVDLTAETVTFSTTRADGVTASFAALGITDASTVTEGATTAILTIGKPCSADSSVYAVRFDARLPIENANEHPLSIKVLNTESENGSHANDDFRTSSVEISFREILDLTKADHHRYQLAFYPRVKKVKDDLYLMAYHVNELGAHTYWVTSEDGVHWNTPNLMYNNTLDYAKVPTYTYGPLEGKSDDKFCAVNPDACVLDNGEILYVFAVRPGAGYRYYPELSGIFLTRGTVAEDNTITWTEPEQITYGQVWEPFIWQRPDGQVEIYWSNAAPYMNLYGYDTNVRSAGVSMILSNDNGHTWSPTKEEGKANNYLYNRVYQEYIGNSKGTGADGKPLVSTAVPYFAGQMPAVTRLYDGRSLLAVEVRQLNQTFDFSFAVSRANGEWDTFGLTEEGPANAHHSIFDAAGPYLATFPSGEVYLTYHWANRQYYKMGDPNGNGFTDERYIAAPNARGLWGSSELIGSHEVITAAQLRYDETVTGTDGTETTRERYGIELVHSYLNHRTNAQKFAVAVDGYTNDWANNTDALFIGSDSQAQLSVQTAHDKDNVYFLLSRLDEKLNEGDTVSLYVNSVCITVAMDGSFAVDKTTGKGVSKVYGTVGDNTDTDEGVLIELAIPKSALGLTNATSFLLVPVLTNVDEVGGSAITDTLTNVKLDQMANRPQVVLD